MLIHSVQSILFWCCFLLLTNETLKLASINSRKEKQEITQHSPVLGGAKGFISLHREMHIKDISASMGREGGELSRVWHMLSSNCASLFTLRLANKIFVVNHQ